MEGFHDKQAVLRAVEADVWVLGGDRVARHLLAELLRASGKRGVVVLTDPDGPGERIRRRVTTAVPGCKHAFIPKEKAKGKGAVGVEHAAPEDILDALLHARSTTDPAASSAARQEGFAIADLMAHQLVGHPEAAKRREALGTQLGIGYANAKAFVWKLNALGVTRQEFAHALKQLDGEIKGQS